MIIRCNTCNREFERQAAQVKERNYCSRKCLGAANAKRFFEKRLGLCDGCGKTIEIPAGHKKRNKHFFCSTECAWKYKEKKVSVRCDWCRDEIVKKRSAVDRNRHNFCDRGCYIDFINFERAGALRQRVGGEAISRTLAAVKEGRPLTSADEVHHIDGDHGNNAADNLMVVSKSKHAQIHASRKERDRLGRFIKKS